MLCYAMGYLLLIAQQQYLVKYMRKALTKYNNIHNIQFISIWQP